MFFRHPSLEYSKILRETAKFAEILENLNKISISMIRPVKSTSSLPLVTPIVTNLDYDINTQQPHLTGKLHPATSPAQGDNNLTPLEENCQQIDITEFLSFNFPEETSDQSMLL